MGRMLSDNKEIFAKESLTEQHTSMCKMTEPDYEIAAKSELRKVYDCVMKTHNFDQLSSTEPILSQYMARV